MVLNFRRIPVEVTRLTKLWPRIKLAATYQNYRNSRRSKKRLHTQSIIYPWVYPWVNNRLGVQPLHFQDLHGRDFISRLMYFQISRDYMKNIHCQIYFIIQSCQSKLSDTTPISLSRTKLGKKPVLLSRCR